MTSILYIIIFALQNICIFICCLYYLKKRKQFLDFCSEYKVAPKIYWNVGLSTLAVLYLLIITGLLYGRALHDSSILFEAWIPIAALSIAVRQVVEHWRKFADKY